MNCATCTRGGWTEDTPTRVALPFPFCAVRQNGDGTLTGVPHVEPGRPLLNRGQHFFEAGSGTGTCFTFATVKTDPVRYAVVCATAGLLSPSVFLIAIRACIQRDVQSVELRLLVRHLPYRAVALVESSELKPNVGSARAIAVLRETKETKFW